MAASLTIVGLNHRSAPAEWRERFALVEAGQDALADELGGGMLLATCDRIEVITSGGETRALAPLLARRHIVAVFTRPAQRAAKTAALAGLAHAKPDPDLWEWDYGGYEGLTTTQIRKTRPGWYLWRDGVTPGDAEHPGETVEQVGERADQVLGRVTPLLADGDVALVAHGHMLRVLTARYLRLEPTAGRMFRLDTGTVSKLGAEHAEPVIMSWNVQP